MEYRAPPTERVSEDQPTESNRVSRTTFVREVTAVYRGPRRAATVLRTPQTAADFIRKLLPDNSREHFVVLHLDGAHQVIGYAVVATGTANSCVVHPREVFQGAILMGAVALIISHNHPSGDETPSTEDRTLTTRLKEAAQLLGMKILDHVIVTNEGFHSLAEEGQL